MIVFALTSLIASIFDIKHYLHLQVSFIYLLQQLSDAYNNHWALIQAHTSSYSTSSSECKERRLRIVVHHINLNQYWRLLAHHVAFSNSSDLLLAELLLYNVSIPVERMFGSSKFAVQSHLKHFASLYSSE